MSECRIRHMFPGGNTCSGFYSYFKYIIDLYDSTRVFIIKGGPGTGKSTLMKNIGNEFCNRGYDIEFMHCASDPESLDGVVIPALKTALIDGTAPHVVDPGVPGAIDEIINLGQCWNRELLSLHKKEIMDAINEISNCYGKCYRYLKASAMIQEDIARIYSDAFDHSGIYNAERKILKELSSIDRFDLFGRQPPEAGKIRYLFASAITPSGPVNYLPSILETYYICRIKGNPGTFAEVVVKKIMDAFISAGYDVEAYCCGFDPSRVEHIVVPGAGVSITTSNAFHNSNDIEPHMEIDMDEYTERILVSANSGSLEYDRQKFNDLFGAAIKSISEAKTIHESIEGFYTAGMDFAAVRSIEEELVGKIDKLKYLF